MPWSTGTRSLRPRAATTGFFSVDRISSRQLRSAQRGDPEPVAAVHGDESASFGIDRHPVVGLGAVEVESPPRRVVAGGEGARALRVQQRGEGAGAGQVVRVVDLQHPGGVGAHQSVRPKKRCPASRKPRASMA